MALFHFDVEAIRSQFPACKRTMNGFPVAYLDGPGGSQVPQRVADAITNYLFNHNANEGGAYATSMESDRLFDEAQAAMADFLGCKPGEVGFGMASTQNNFNLAFALARNLKPGDKVLITEMDHRCNRAPWEALADFGMVVDCVRVDRQTQQIDMEDYQAKLPGAKVVAFNWASNAIGTISDAKFMCALAHAHDAITVVDAVHYAAHCPIDVKAIDADVLLCSAYKFFGPHVGVIYIKESLLNTLTFYNAKVEDIMEGIRKFHFGTPAFEAICGAGEAVAFIASVGEQYAHYFEDELKGLTGRRRNVVAGMLAFDTYEMPLAKQLREGLRAIPGVTVYGPAEGQRRTSTVSFTIAGKTPLDISTILGKQGIFTWDGHFYAVELVNDVLGLKDSGGVVRLGLAPYNTRQDVDRVLKAVEAISNN